MPFLFPKPPSLPALPPPPPVVERDDPNVEAQRKAVLAAEKRRKGRQASIATGTDLTDEALISTPELSAKDDTLGS